MQVTPSGATTAPPTVVSNISYLPFGPISSYSLGNGQVITRTYDANYRLTDLTSSALNLHFALDAMGDIAALGNAPGANPATETYSYDPLYRLTGITDAGTALESYTYNPTGDRLSKTAPGLATGAYLYTTGTHRLAKIGTAVVTNDADGNMTADVIGGNAYGFSYNARNRLAALQLNGGTVANYTYNAMDERIGKVATYPQAVNELYAYDEAGHLVGEYGTTNRDYVWLGDIPVAVIDNTISDSVTTSAVNYVTADQLGTPRVVTNGAGTVIWQWAYQGNPFGEQQPTSSGYVLNLRFPGQYFDGESGMSNWGFRSYSAATSRSPQSDPAGLFGGQWSTYAYVGSDPLDYIDPLGLAPHQYTVTDFICYAAQSGCTPQNVFNQLRRYPAPFSDGNPVSTGDISNIPGLGHVVHTVDPTHCSVTNTTEPDHTLYPGQVTRSVVQNADGSIDVVTTGTGDGAFSALNDALADPLWGAVDWNVASPWVAQPPAFNHY